MSLDTLSDAEQAALNAQTLDTPIGVEESDVVYFGNPLCPWAHRAWITLELKKIPFRYRQVPLIGFPKPADFLKLNPRGQVPTLQVDDHIIRESDIVVDFLDELYPNKGQKLIPTDAYELAAARLFTKEFASMVSLFYRLRNEDDPAKQGEHIEKLRAMTKDLEAKLEKQSQGPYFLGDRLSIADVNCYPHIHRYATSLEQKGFNLFKEAPRFEAWYKALKEIEAFDKTSQPVEFYAKCMKMARDARI